MLRLEGGARERKRLPPRPNRCPTPQVSDGDCPHVLFYGPSGAGKKTLVLALLREIYGPGVERVKVEAKEWKVDAGSRKVDIELTLVTSNYHTEMNPSDVGSTKDRLIVQEVIKEMARSRPIGADGTRGFKGACRGRGATHVVSLSSLTTFPLPVLVLNEVDKLSKEAQHALRRTMEKYSSACRLVLVCNNISKVLDAVRSRTLPIRVPAATEAQIAELLLLVARKEGVALPPEFAGRVAAASDRSMRRALLSLEACKVTQYPFTVDQVIQNTDWELYIAQIAREIMSEQSPKSLYNVRNRLYELLVNAISPELILKKLTSELLAKVDGELKAEVVAYAAYFEHRLQQGTKAIIHLEAFVARFMAIYKKFLLELFG